MKKKLSKIVVKPSVAKEWCSYCQDKSITRRKDLDEKEFEFWECKKCKLISEYRK